VSAAGFGIYVHWPYCARICPYCAFNVYRDRGEDHDALRQAIVADIRAHRARFGPRRVMSVFFGGGTPSLLSGADIESLIDAIAHAYDLAPDAEITLEANPEDRGRFADHVRAGVNRLSLGVQSLDDASLKKLFRTHDARDAARAVDTAASTGARVSIDMIYAREGQGIGQWREELTSALALQIEHVSLYQLTIEDGVAFARARARGLLRPPDDDAAAALYEATQDVCVAHGFPAYEISNHARAPAARSRHNLLYWRGEEWIGVGPGAHGRIDAPEGRLAVHAHASPRDYSDGVRAHGLGWASQAILSASEIADETLIMGLRMVEGVAVARAGPLNQQKREQFARDGFIADAGERIALTARGRLLADRIAAELSGAD